MYSEHKTGKEAESARPAEEGEPPGINDSKKNIHKSWTQLWWEYVEGLAEAEGTPPNYSLIQEPPAEGSGQVEQANGVKILAFYQWLLD